MRQWYVIRSKPKKEDCAASYLGRAGIEAYIPKLPSRIHPGKVSNLEALFPGYLFARLDPVAGDVRLARYARGVLYVLGYGDEPTPIADDILARIKYRSERACASRDVLDFRTGEPVVITTGPFQDVEAIFDRRLSGPGRVRLLIRLVGRFCAVQIDQRHVRRPKQAAMGI